MTKPKHNPRLITEKDIRWEENLLRIVSGLAALAEAYAEGSNTELKALHYSLESLRELMKDSVEDLRERMKQWT